MHGKCVSGDTRILLADGSITTAKQLYENIAQSGELYLDDEGKQIHTAKGISIFSLNKNTGRIQKKLISYAWKLVGGDLIKIKLRNGFSIETTPEHKYVVLEKNELTDKLAQDLKLGDRVVCARNTDTESNLCIKSYILNKLSEKNFYARFNKEFGNKLKKSLLEYGLSKVAESIGTKLLKKSLYHGAWQNRYALDDLVKLANLFSISLTEIYDNIDTICYRNGKRRGRNSLPIKLPHNFKDFFCLAGMFIGDGTTHKFVVGKPMLGEHFIEICTDLGIRVRRRNYPNKTPELTTNKTLMFMLNAIFDYPLKQKSRNVRISEFVYKAPKEYAAAFLRGYFDCDGTVEKSRRAISLTSASPNMLNDLKVLMSRFGCIPIIQNDTIYISGLSAKAFLEQIGFYLNEKMAKAEKLVSTMTGSYVADILPLISRRVMITNFGKLSQMEMIQTQKLRTGDLAFIEITGIESTYSDKVYDFTVPDTHNFIAEGMIIHNTTLSDNLLAGAGMISEELAGKQLAMDFLEEEQQRGITIQTANISMVHDVGGEEHLINLLDTPGHVDFGGDVTRAMRAVDGAVVVACAVEGAMPQTETVLRQAIKERVKPILFINKVDRLIKELQLTPEKMQEQFVKIINNINNIIKDIAPKEFKDKWTVSVQDGSVAFGSAYHNWGLSYSMMQKKSISFKDVLEAYSNDKVKDLAKKAPLHEAVLDMVVKHLPNPVDAQAYRIPKLWSGEMDSELGRQMASCDPDGKLALIVTKVIVDPQAGEIACARIFSGTMTKGQNIHLNLSKRDERIQQIFLYKGGQRIAVEEAICGNIVGIGGLHGAASGETVSEGVMEPFESIKHIFEPVVTKAIEAKSPKDLPKLIEILKQLAKEDPTIVISINEETGENLMSGLGELHLEIKEHIITRDRGLQIVSSPPIVVYRESVKGPAGPILGKSPNKHNHLFVSVEPMSEQLFKAIISGEVPETRIKKKKNEIVDALTAGGMLRDDALNVKDIYKGNILMDSTRGIVHIQEIIELVMQAFEEVCDAGPMAKEPMARMIIKLEDCKLHEDSIHRGPAQIIPAMRQGVLGAMLKAGAILYEPIQTIRIDSPVEYLGAISKLIQGRRGQLLDTSQETGLIVKCKLPVAEMFGFTSALRSATSGHGAWFLVDQSFEKLPENMQNQIITRIRERKGMKKEIPTYEEE